MNNQDTQFSIDAFPPAKMAERAEDIGVIKANMDFWTMFGLAILAGAFIAMGAVFSTTVTAADYSNHTVCNLFLNLIPVTLGKIIGGSVMVGLVYWFVYRRKAIQSS